MIDKPNVWVMIDDYNGHAIGLASHPETQKEREYKFEYIPRTPLTDNAQALLNFTQFSVRHMDGESIERIECFMGSEYAAWIKRGRAAIAAASAQQTPKSS